MDNPIPQFEYFVSQLKDRHPDFAYLHLIEPRISGIDARQPEPRESNNFIRDIWAPKQIIAAGGYSRKDALEVVEQHNCLVAFGRWFISNVRLCNVHIVELALTCYVVRLAARSS